MSDLVKRLREHSGVSAYNELMEAADEIERLEKEQSDILHIIQISLPTNSCPYTGSSAVVQATWIADETAKRIERLEKLAFVHMAEDANRRQRIEELEKERDELKAKLKKYGAGFTHEVSFRM